MSSRVVDCDPEAFTPDTCSVCGTVDCPEVQCESCKEWWPECSEDVPHESDYCTVSMVLCDECRHEVNND